QRERSAGSAPAGTPAVLARAAAGNYNSNLAHLVPLTSCRRGAHFWLPKRESSTKDMVSASARRLSREPPSGNRPGLRITLRPMRRTLAFVCYTPTLGTVRVRHRGAGLMNHNFASKVGLALIACSLAGIVVGQTQPAAFKPQLSENVYKNIQII